MCRQLSLSLSQNWIECRFRVFRENDPEVREFRLPFSVRSWTDRDASFFLANQPDLAFLRTILESFSSKKTGLKFFWGQRHHVTWSQKQPKNRPLLWSQLQHPTSVHTRYGANGDGQVVQVQHLTLNQDSRIGSYDAPKPLLTCSWTITCSLLCIMLDEV